MEAAAVTELVRNPRPQTFSHLWEILGRYRKSLLAQDWESADELDLMFHRELVYASGSRRLIHAFDTVAVETRMCMRYMLFGHVDHPDMDTWHSDILEAAERGDLDAAHRALEFHNETVIADFTSVSPTKRRGEPAGRSICRICVSRASLVRCRGLSSVGT